MKHWLVIFLSVFLSYGLALNECDRCEGGASQCYYNDTSTGYNCLQGCFNGYYGPSCTNACKDVCLTCTNGQSCTSCKEGYFGSYCNKCSNNCLTCSAEYTCNSCKDGFYIGYWHDTGLYTYSSQCILKCQDNCESCKSYYNCNKCVDGKFNGIHNDCRESCNTGCKSCTSYNNCTACQSGKYGTSCQNDCALGCKNGQCSIHSGICSCISNFQGSLCNQCVPGRYGSYCRIPCPTNCASNSCNSNGDCFRCKEGFSGGKCNSCETGKYGDNCEIQCPSGCASNTCARNGNCKYGCRNNFFGYKCDQCVDGKFGSNCDKDCAFNCKSCTSASSCSVCRQGYWGDSCQECPQNCSTCSSNQFCTDCDPGYFGHVCSAQCPVNCKNGVCDKISGTCFSCNDGFYGNNCDPCPENCASTCYSNGNCQYCKNGYYGGNCSNKCSSYCKSCNKYGGSCTTCIDGYYGPPCNKTCPSACRTGTKCSISDGYCTDCADGYFKIYSYGSYLKCDKCKVDCNTCTKSSWKCTSCTAGKYGYNSLYQYYSCDKMCPKTCKHKACDVYSGKCDDGCINGYWGDKCEYTCSENCLDGECFSNNGTCVFGCNEGYTGYECRCSSNCNCDTFGNCISCKSGFENQAHSCLCSKRFCEDNECTSCSNSSFYRENEFCCKCSRTCRQNECDSGSKCTQGCVKGYRGGGCLGMCKDINQRCSQCTSDYTNSAGRCLECVSGYYLDGNTKHCAACSENCANNTCNSQNGICTMGCKNGYWGRQCETNCTTTCLQCNQSDGRCSVCKGGKYLLDCSKECSSNCSTLNDVKVCAISDGSCVDGCSSPSLYGKHCDLNCNSNCLKKTCDWNTGHCLNGCVDNFYGEKCDQDCNVNCVTVDKDKRCDDVTGYCITGCTDGFHGKFCNQTCSSTCLNATCDKESGKCIHGCSSGYTGTSCSIAAEQTGFGDDGTGVTIGAAVGGGLFLVIFIALVAVFLLFRKRRRRETSKTSIAELDKNTDNSAVTYSEIKTTGLPVEQNDADAVYAMPNKPKKNVDRIKSSTGSTRTIIAPENEKIPSENKNIVTNPNNENRQSYKDDLHTTQNVQKRPISTKPVPVYDNSADKGSAARVTASIEPTIYSIDSALEIEEDLDIIKTSSRLSTKSITQAGRLNTTESDLADTYYNVAAVKKRKIALDQLPDFVSKKTKAAFVEEFQQLPPGLIKPYVDSQKRENLSKNRYKGIYPYDETRVVLKEGDSDYINASYIDGYNKRKAYIASIGPTFKYMGDMSAFWIMVWQEKVGKIVMLTKLDEGGAPKCDQYWPEKDFSLPYASIQVTCQSEESYADYTIRSFTIQKGSENRKIVQVHFTAWPDKGTPDDVTSLIEFRQKVISTKTELEGPILVHCSAGIGRTGTYIALDSLTEEGEAEGEVDIYAFVRNMREQRVNMVQTAEQYQYLHNALVHTLTFDSKAVEASKFDRYMTSHTDDHLGEKFEKLQAFVEQRSDDEVDAVKRNQALRNKNRVGADIPGDRNRPKLYLERKLGSSDYINAVYVNSYTTINRYLVAQTPLPDTVVDFLTLIIQEKVACIVSMETDSVDDKTIGAYYPADNQTLKKGTFTVKSVRENDTEQYVIRKLEIVHKGKFGTEDVRIPHIQLTQWNENKNIPEEPAKFVQFVKDVEVKYGGNQSKGPILVHCLTGAEKSGLFCVVSNLLEKTQIDQETSVVNAVRQIKYRRHMSIPNKDQYIFCHQCVNEYLRTFDIYSNFELKT